MLVIFALLACKGGDLPADSSSELPSLEPPDSSEGFQLSMTSSAPPYSEVWDCAVYKLPVDEAAPVNRVEFLQNEGTHHMTISTTALSGKSLEPGMYDCDSLYADNMEELTMMFGNQGAGEGVMQLPEGVVANLPPSIDIVHEVHYVNPTAETVEIFSYLNAYTIPESEVISGIWGGSVRDENINIPANADGYSEWSRCVMNEDVEVHFLASHTHALGVEFTIAPFDGVETGEIFYRNDDWHDPRIEQYDPPRIVPAGQGFEFACTWKNESAEPITYGLLSTDEMCNLAIVHTPFSTSARCEVVETSDGVLWP